MVRIGARQSGPLRSGTGFEKAQEWPAAAGLTIFRWTSCSNSFFGRLQGAAPQDGAGPRSGKVPPGHGDSSAPAISRKLHISASNHHICELILVSCPKVLGQ